MCADASRGQSLQRACAAAADCSANGARGTPQGGRSGLRSCSTGEPHILSLICLNISCAYHAPMQNWRSRRSAILERINYRHAYAACCQEGVKKVHQDLNKGRRAYRCTEHIENILVWIRRESERTRRDSNIFNLFKQPAHTVWMVPCRWLR